MSWLAMVSSARDMRRPGSPSRTADILTTAITSPPPANTLFSDTAPFRASLRFGRTADPRHTITAGGPCIMSRPASSTAPARSVHLGNHSSSGGVSGSLRSVVSVLGCYCKCNRMFVVHHHTSCSPSTLVGCLSAVQQPSSGIIIFVVVAPGARIRDLDQLRRSACLPWRHLASSHQPTHDLRRC